MDLAVFEGERDRLAALAARILGADLAVDDVLQAARLHLADAVDIDDPPAWLTTLAVNSRGGGRSDLPRW